MGFQGTELNNLRKSPNFDNLEQTAQIEYKKYQASNTHHFAKHLSRLVRFGLSPFPSPDQAANPCQTKSKMEAIFGYIEFKEEELFDSSEPHEDLSVTKSLKQLARNVSFVALKPFRRFRKVQVSIETAEKKSVVQSAVSTAKIATTMFGNITSGIYKVLRGAPLDRRPTWDSLSHFAFDFLRSTMQGSGVTNLQQLRFGEEFGSRWIDHTPEGVKISLVIVEYDSEILLSYEKNAK